MLASLVSLMAETILGRVEERLMDTGRLLEGGF